MTNFGDISGSAARSGFMTNTEMTPEEAEELPPGQGGPGKGEASDAAKAQVAADSINAAGGVETPDVEETEEPTKPGEGGEVEGGEGEGETEPEVPPYIPPKLPEPVKIAFATDLSILLNTLSLAQQKENAEKTVNEIKANSAEKQVKFKEQMDKLEENIANAKKNAILNVFQKIFAVIGAVLGMIAGALAVAASAATGNPLLAAAGIMALVASFDSLLSTASDGKISMSAGITAALVAMGVDEQTANWVAFGAQMAMIVVGVALGFASGGGSAVSSFSNLASMFSKAENVAKVTQMIQKATNILKIAASLNQGAMGGLGVGKAVVEGDIKQNEATQLDIQGAIEKVKQRVDVLQGFFKSQLELYNTLTKMVKDIIDDSIKTKTAIQRAAVS